MNDNAKPPTQAMMERDGYTSIKMSELSRLSAIEARCGDEEQMAGQLFLSVPGLTMDLARRCSRYLSRFLKEGK